MTRKILIFLNVFMLLMSFHPKNLYARQLYVNNYGIEINENEQQRLLYLGFNADEIMNLTLEEYEMNKDLYGEIISESSSSGILRDTVTEYKTMRTTIIKLSNGNYRFKVDLQWKITPKVRSYDIIGIGIDSSKVAIVSSHVVKQTYIMNNTSYSTSSVSNNISNRGVTSVIKIPEGTVENMNISLYVDVKIIGSGTIIAYGDYAHAVKTINLTNAKRVNFGSSELLIPSDLTSYYDEIHSDKVTF